MTVRWTLVFVKARVVLVIELVSFLSVAAELGPTFLSVVAALAFLSVVAALASLSMAAELVSLSVVVRLVSPLICSLQTFPIDYVVRQVSVRS